MTTPYRTPPWGRLAPLVAALLFLSSGDLAAQALDLTRAVVYMPPGLGGPAARAGELLSGEVAERSWARWPVVSTWPGSGTVIAVGPLEELKALAASRSQRLPAMPEPEEAEGFRIWVERDGARNTVFIAGNDALGTLFGAGHLLRKLNIERERVTLPRPLEVETAPVTPLRGHQLGYRATPNSYDAFTLEMWEEYIRDLLVFGANTIELIAPDGRDSPVFPLDPLSTMAGMSEIADSYGMDVWVWWPIPEADYSDAAQRERVRNEWDAVLKRVPEVDAVFVPGGDPGDTPPEQLLPLLERQAELLREHHPGATMWVSVQGFDPAEMDTFLEMLEDGQDWLEGVVYGPWTRIPLPEFREAVPERYELRRYPDITHTYLAQYPVPDMDRAFLLTHRREPINPRPVDQRIIFDAYDEVAPLGFITYSEGINDDVNKAIWSQLGWDPETELEAVLRDYARFFIGPELEGEFAAGLIALEENWRGAAATNEGIDRTLVAFQAMEAAAGPRQRLSWRFLLHLYRAYYDAYVRARLLHERHLQEQALGRLQQAEEFGSLRALQLAESVIYPEAAEPVAPELRDRIEQLAEALFQAIRYQVSEEKYFGAAGRDQSLDYIDVPLSDRAWLRGQFRQIRGLASEEERLARIDSIVHRTDPGPGGFYDDLGDPWNRPHLVIEARYEDDPMFFRYPAPFVNRDTTVVMPWRGQIVALFEAPLEMKYTGLDPEGEYRLRVIYGRSNREFEKGPRFEMDGDEVHSYHERYYEPLEFAVPSDAVEDGELELAWYRDPDVGGPGRGNQIAEVWLFKEQPPADDDSDREEAPGGEESEGGEEDDDGDDQETAEDPNGADEAEDSDGPEEP